MRMTKGKLDQQSKQLGSRIEELLGISHVPVILGCESKASQRRGTALRGEVVINASVRRGEVLSCCPPGVTGVALTPPAPAQCFPFFPFFVDP